MSPRLAIRSRAAIAAAAATSLALTPLAALATETPEATPEAISAEESETTEGEQPLPLPTSNEFALGQSLQIRVGPDGEPNSSLLDFRWSVNQLTVQGPEEGPQEVPVPDRGDMIRSLLDFSNPPQEDGIATLTADMANGYGLARTVSLFPQDEQPPIELTASFTLDGQPIDPWDLVGKSGDVTASYTLTNTSTTEMEVEVTDLAGETVTRTVEADVPMVGITKVLIPQRFTGLSLKGGTFGADGRGNNQVQFISLPFRPISEDGTATFGWSARVEDAVIPSMVVQVAPIYIPEDDPETPQDESSQGGGGLGIPPPNLDPAVAEIQAGVQNLVAGLDTLANSGDGSDPLQDVEDRLNTFFADLGINVQDLADTLGPTIENIDAAQAAIAEAIPLVEEINGFVPSVLQSLASLLQDPTLVAVLTDIAGINPDTVPGQAKCALYLAAIEEATGTVLDCQTLIQLANDLLGLDPNDLNALAGYVQGTTDVLIPLLNTVSSLLTDISGSLVGLQETVQTIADGLAEAGVDLPTLDSVIAQIVDDVLNSPGGQQVTGGLSQISGGIDDAKTELGNYISEAVVTLQGVGAEVSETVQDVDEKVVTLKAEVGGMVMAAHQSPLPYGGDPADAPADTVLAGAYEFRVDAADQNQPSTGPRVLVGLVALIGAGALSYVVGSRRGDRAASGRDASGGGGSSGGDAPEPEPVST